MSDENGTANNNNNTTMNLDLNLGPGSLPATEDNPINLDEWSDVSPERIREAVRLTSRQRWWRLNIGNHQTESQNLTMDLSQLLTSVGIQGRGLHMGEGSVAAEERMAEVEKVCEDKVTVVDEEAVGSQDDDDKGSGEEGSFYDCNICFELAKDPVITCCGHLYCWPCIYRWLHIHSDASECPVCKGEVKTKTVTPIYGRGHNKGVPDEDLTIRIPPRPTVKRVHTRLARRQARNRSTETSSHFPSSTSASERVIEAYMQSHPIVARRTEQSPSVDDRDSFSSIAAVMHSGSQTNDTAVEIDSVVSVSTSSSRRRNDISRASDVGSGDSRPPRRRRLN